jgi:hypothetical protein
MTNVMKVAIVDAAIQKLWDGNNVRSQYDKNSVRVFELYACYATVKAAMLILGLEYGEAKEHPDTLWVLKRIDTYIDGYFTASSYLREKDDNYDETYQYAQAFRKKMLEDIRKELMA